MATADVFAPAKINLTLHVTGQRDDGYHLIDSLVVFADVGDRVSASPAEGLSLSVEGPEAAGLAAEDDNLVLRAARAFGADQGAALRLEKVLPVASGIGGGSADAAAALTALAQLWNLPLPSKDAVLALGADVPVCLSGRPARMRGIGEVLDPAPELPLLDILLVNPRVSVSTPAVFRALASKTNPSMPPLPRWHDAKDFCAWLSAQRNDLTVPAQTLAPEIGEALAIIRETAPLFTGMSGSGATCFGLFAPGDAAAKARAQIKPQRPDWWAAAAKLLR